MQADKASSTEDGHPHKRGLTGRLPAMAQGPPSPVFCLCGLHVIETEKCALVDAAMASGALQHSCSIGMYYGKPCECLCWSKGVIVEA